MSGIELLPDDLLGDILLLLDDKSAEQKFAVAQVSRRWRRVALQSPLLWSSFRLETIKDWSRLPIILKRTGSSSMLDVELFPDADDTITRHPRVEALVPYATRLRTIVIETSLLDKKIEPLLDIGLDFPSLDTLQVRGQLGLDLASAPALRVLELTRAFPRDLNSVLPAAIEEIRLVLSSLVQPSDLPAILTRCPRLRHLTFHTFDYDAVFAESGLLNSVSRRPVAPDLRTLDLQLAQEDIICLLDTCFSDVVLPEISACVYNGHDLDDMTALFGAMLCGLGALVSFDLRNSQCAVLRDAAGRVRTMRVWNDDSCWEFQDVWGFLSDKFAFNTTVRYIVIDITDWDELADALEQHPIQTARGVTIRVLTDWEDVHLFRQCKMRDMRDISIPGLDCVELACSDDTSLPAPVVVHILLRLQLKDVRTIKVGVVVDGAVPKDTPTDIWKEAMKAYVEQEGQGRWDVTFI